MPKKDRTLSRTMIAGLVFTSVLMMVKFGEACMAWWYSWPMV